MPVKPRTIALWPAALRVVACLALVASVALTLPLSVHAQTGGPSPSVISGITVEGNQRIERETVLTYIGIRPGDPFSAAAVDEALKTLFATGLFSDVNISVVGSTLLVQVSENPIVNRVVFEGNRRLNDDRLAEEVEIRARSVFTRARVQSDVQRLVEIYRQSGRFAASVDPKVVQLDQNRVDLVFEITEGPITNIGRITFVGNERFSDARLRRVITTRQSRWYAVLRSADTYDPDRVAFDQELLRRFYLSEGYADFQVVSAAAELSPDNSTFFITFTVEEGEPYTFGPGRVETTLEDVPTENLENVIAFREGDEYNAELIDTTIDSLTFIAGTLGYAFVDVRPQVRRDRENKVIFPTFIVREGPRVYVERINITGNQRTLDRVIRREMRLVEGDAYNRVLLNRSRSRIRGLGFFSQVEVEEVPGSAPDRTVLNVDVEEQPTGELQFGVGFSTTDSVIGDISLVERNLLGRGQFLRLRLSASGRRQQIDLRFTEPQFRDRNLAVGFDAFQIETDFEDESGFDNNALGLGLRAGFPLSEFSQLNLNYTIRQDDIRVDDVDCATGEISSIICAEEGEELTSALGYSYYLDRRNDPIDPSGGFDFLFSQNFAGIGGDVNYLENEVRARYYLQLFRPNWVGIIQLDGGYIDDVFGDESVRTSDRFLRGGTTFRGFEFGGIGPRDLGTDDALGGKVYGVGTAELRFPLSEELGFRGGLFTQAGTVGQLDDAEIETATNPNDIVDDLSLRVTAGVSIYWNSPIGPIRFDFSDAIQKEDYDKTESFRFGGTARF